MLLARIRREGNDETEREGGVWSGRPGSGRPGGVGHGYPHTDWGNNLGGMGIEREGKEMKNIGESITLRKDDDNDKLWDSIPDYALGETPENIYDENPDLYRCIVVKRALKAGYGEVDDFQITDILVDLMHFCDVVKQDFYEHEKTARIHYLAEIGSPGTGIKGKEKVGK